MSKCETEEYRQRCMLVPFRDEEPPRVPRKVKAQRLPIRRSHHLAACLLSLR